MYPQTAPGEIYISDEEDNTYYESYKREQQQQPSVIRNLNYFQPIQDPLEALYKNSSQGFYQQPPPPPQQQQIPRSTDGMQPFDLGNLINRIQEDYVNSARPYVSSIQFVQSEQNLANMGLITPSTNRKGFFSSFCPINIINILLKIIQDKIDHHIIMMLLMREMVFIQHIQNNFIIKIIIHQLKEQNIDHNIMIENSLRLVRKEKLRKK